MNRMHCHEELKQDLGYTGLLPDVTLHRWFEERYSTSKHLLTLYSIAKSLPARRILEIGFGRSSFVLARAAYENRGYFTSCDRNKWDDLFTKQEKRVTKFVHGEASELWPNLGNGIDLAFLDYFSDEHLKDDLLSKEVGQCVARMKQNGLILIHDTFDPRYRVGALIDELADQFDLEHVRLPYNYGLSILRRTAESPNGALYDSQWKKPDPESSEFPRVFVPAHLGEQFTGGPCSFMRNLFRGFTEAKIPFIGDESQANGADVVFFPIKYDIAKLEKWKKEGKKIIQRLDGVYYPSQHGAAYEERNADIEYIYKHLADVIVFQSGYSRDQCFEVMGAHSAGRECVIYNGASSLFRSPPRKEKELQEVFKAAMVGHFRHPVMLEPVIEAVNQLNGKVQLSIAGKVDDKLMPLLEESSVSARGEVTPEEVSALYQDSDFAIYSFLNPNCPNAVIEATVSGLPVVGFNSGSMHELCLHNHELLASVSESVIQIAEDFDADRLREKLELCMAHCQVYQKEAVQVAPFFSLERMIREYRDLFAVVCNL